jgi:hypothetical protein
LAIRDAEDGRLITVISRGVPNSAIDVEVNEQLSQLYDVVRRKVLGTDEALGKLLADIEQLDEELPPF